MDNRKKIIAIVAVSVVVFFSLLFLDQNKRNQENKAAADVIIAMIDGLKDVETISSLEDIDLYEEELANIEREIEFATIPVQALIDNKDKYEATIEELEKFKDEHLKQVECGACLGNGDFYCNSCDGKGKKLVKWYEYGDWGPTSYTSYECTSCDGRGDIDCSRCSNGKVTVFE